ncbi:MAG: SipW-dependent-type signal peptide-containing protein, partial [Erysipelotrichaceae bacterium]
MKNTKTKLISSVTVLLICFAMLIGSTFAWFTDSASTGVNKIQAGTLQIDLKMKGESGDWVNAEGQSLTWQKADGYENQEVLWEPGATYKLPTLKITNNGNLALQFKVLINGVSGDLELLDALEFSYAFNWMEEDNYRVDSGSFEGSAMRTMPYEIPFDRAEVENNIFGEELDLLNGYLLYTADDDPTHIG